MFTPSPLGNERAPFWEKIARWPGWRHPRWAAGAAAAASALAAAIVWWMTAHWGPGADSDGLAYLILARQIAAGHGYGYPLPGGGIYFMTHFPPGYPLTLAGVHFLIRGTMAQAALAVSIASYVLLIVLAGATLYPATRHAWPVAGLVFWLAVSYGLLRIFGWARSETVFLGLVWLLGWVVSRWEARPSAAGALAAGLLAGWIVFVRWIGVAVWGWLVLWLACYPGRRARWRDAVLAGVGGGVPVGLLLLVNHVRGAAATNRRLLWHPPGWAKWQEALRTVGEWVFGPWHPQPATAALLGALVVAAVTAAVVAAWRQAARAGDAEAAAFHRLAARWGSFMAVYFVALVLAISWVDAATPLDWRLLVPLLPAGAVVAAAAVWRLLAPHPRWAMAAALLWAGFLVFNLQTDYRDLFDMRWGGVAVRSYRWQQAALWPALRALPQDVQIFTNDLEATIYYTGRPARRLEVPVSRGGRLYRYDPSLARLTPLPYPTMKAWGQAVARSLRGQCGVFVYITLKEDTPQPAALTQAFEVLARYPSGLLLIPPGSEQCLRAP